MLRGVPTMTILPGGGPSSKGQVASRSNGQDSATESAAPSADEDFEVLLRHTPSPPDTPAAPEARPSQPMSEASSLSYASPDLASPVPSAAIHAEATQGEMPPDYTPSEDDPPSHEESLQDVALSVPDIDAADSISQVGANDADDADARLHEDESTRHQADWSHMLGLSGQTLGAATSATSLGFAAARQTTAFGLGLAKRITQGIVALPAIAFDGAVLGNAPSMDNYRDGNGNSTPTAAEVAHAAVGGVFDLITTFALGGIDIGSAITGAGLGAAAAGVEGTRRALGSEVVRSLSAFSKLVKREWNSASDDLPPGGIPAYSIVGITQALTAWVLIQMVTRDYYETKMIRQLQEVDLEAVQREIDEEKREEAAAAPTTTTATAAAATGTETVPAIGTTAAPAVAATTTPVQTQVTAADANPNHDHDHHHQQHDVRITSEAAMPGENEGDLIGAEIGQPSDAADAAPHDENTDGLVAVPLTDRQAIHNMKRYSKLVLGVYGGVALAWLGSLPPDLMEAAGQVVGDSRLPQVNTNQGSAADQPLLAGGGTGSRATDEADFLRAAAQLDLEDGELIDDEIDAPAEQDQGGAARTATTTMPGAFGSNTPSIRNEAPASGQVLFSADPEETVPSTSTAAQAPAAGVGSGSHEDRPPPARQGTSYSYLDILSGQADADLFHRVAELEDGVAQEGSYDETASQAGSAAERLRRMRQRVARPSQPRYYVVTDHTNAKIVLVLRGSLSLGDLAIDLTCESARFEWELWHGDAGLRRQEEEGDTGSEVPMAAEDFSSEAAASIAGSAATERFSTVSAGTAPGPAPREKQPLEDEATEESKEKAPRGSYIVHEGIYETAKEIGEPGRPVHRAIRAALARHPGYALDIAGHSLGAGVAAMCALMWADPDTCLTTPQSGLPVGRKVHAYSFAAPCVMGAELSQRCKALITTLEYSYDLVARLSLGAILDIRNACAWLAYENSQPATPRTATSTTASSNGAFVGLPNPIRLTTLMQRALLHQVPTTSAEKKTEIEHDFLALRKTLEANMTHVELFPPGSIFYSLAPDDVAASPRTDDRLYRVTGDRLDEVFGQIIFGRGMLSRHMPHIYRNILTALPSS